ncbi:MAG: hypothetical protein AUI14_10470 [Actinobacteria bacterium 13_2_20CM_2_71_6]|nr:MAG: hypothetical protein AUI14_10470 [Actinobacteria bacterium 13_2_20CM_2_71_6]
MAQHGDADQLRQLFVPRGGHCTITAAEEIVALRTMFQRIDTGHWGTTDPAELTRQANEFGPGYQKVHTPLAGFQPVALSAFVCYRPGRYPRPV